MGPLTCELDTGMLMPFGRLVAGVEEPVSAPAQEILGELAGACGRSNVGDAC